MHTLSLPIKHYLSSIKVVIKNGANSEISLSSSNNVSIRSLNLRGKILYGYLPPKEYLLNIKKDNFLFRFNISLREKTNLVIKLDAKNMTCNCYNDKFIYSFNEGYIM